jgi:uncharacterized HAD superfamily protein
MRIGLDLDGVMFDFVGSMRQVFPHIPKDPTEVDLTKYLNPIEQQQFYDMLNSAPMFRNLPVIRGMEHIVPYLNSQETYVITSRNKAVHDATRQSIAAIGLKPQEILFKHRKYKAVRDYGIDVFIDDQVKHVEPLPKEQIALMPDLGYNREFVKKAMDEGRMVFPYHNVEELYDFLKKLEGVAHGGTKG